MSRSLSRPQALLLGAVVLLGLGLGGLGLFAVGSQGWYGKDVLHVRVGFPDIRGVEVGTVVRIRGIRAGEVESVTAPETPDAPVVLRLRLKGEYRSLVRADSTVQIVSEGMIGGKALEIHPGRDAANQPPVADDGLLRAEASAELNDVLGQVSQSLKGIQGGEGTLGLLARDPRAYNALLDLARQSKETMASLQQDVEGVKNLPLVGRYVEDPVALLVRPRCERNRRCFAEAELFEPGRAVLTAEGRQRLDALGPWLEGLKHPGSDVVVVAYADPSKSKPETARPVTRRQSEAVCDYLKQRHSIHKLGWFSSRKVTALGLGVQSPPQPEPTPLPPARVEIVVFVPQE